MGIRFDGLSTGLNTSALIEALMEIERRPLRLAQQRQDGIRDQQALFRELNTQLLTLRDAALAIDNLNSVQTGASLDEELLAYTATSSDESFLRVETTGTANPGEVDVRIDQVAQGGREISNGFADDTAVVATAGQSLQLTVGGTTLVDYTVPAAGASLRDLRAAINSDPNNDGSVRADVLFDGTDYRLIVTSNQTGAANALAITTDIDGPAGAGSPLFDAGLSQTAQDAQLQVFGLTMTRESNEVTDVVPGVTLYLQRPHDTLDPAQTTTVTVERDDADIQASVQALVDAYNGFRDFVQQNATYDPSNERAGPLLGDSTLLRIDRQLRTAFSDSYTIGTNPFSNLSQLGVRFDREGRLSLDADVLQDALDQDVFAVRELLMGDGVGVDGAAAAIGRLLEPITRSGDGSIAIRVDGLEDQTRALGQTIDRIERRLEQREETLLLQFSRLESLVSSLQAQGNYLQSAFGGNSQQ